MLCQCGHDASEHRVSGICMHKDKSFTIITKRGTSRYWGIIKRDVHCMCASFIPAEVARAS